MSPSPGEGSFSRAIDLLIDTRNFFLSSSMNPYSIVVVCCRMFYGPGGPYAMFAGRDASRALSLMSFDPKDLTGNTEGLSESELEVLQDWEYKFMEKYVKVGQLQIDSNH